MFLAHWNNKDVTFNLSPQIIDKKYWQFVNTTFLLFLFQPSTFIQEIQIPPLNKIHLLNCENENDVNTKLLPLHISIKKLGAGEGWIKSTDDVFFWTLKTSYIKYTDLIISKTVGKGKVEIIFFPDITFAYLKGKYSMLGIT